MMRSSARNTSENAPSSCSRASRNAPARVRSRERATRCRITSVSLEAWKIDPSRSSSRRSSPALVMLPLCATAMLPFIARHRKRLGVQQHGIAGGGIAGMADGEFAGQAAEHFRRENIGHVAHALVAMNVAAVAGGDAGAFLAAMLQRVQARDKRDWRPRDGRRWRRRRTPRGICRTIVERVS